MALVLEGFTLLSSLATLCVHSNDCFLLLDRLGGARANELVIVLGERWICSTVRSCLGWGIHVRRRSNLRDVQGVRIRILSRSVQALVIFLELLT